MRRSIPGFGNERPVDQMTLPAWRVARAEANTRRRDREEDARQEREDRANTDAHALSAARVKEAKQSVESPYATLRAALGWFKFEWQTALPLTLHEGWSSVEPMDALGAPAWTARMATYLFGRKPKAGEDPLSDQPPTDPLRLAWLWMSRSSSLFDRCGAVFLFRLACMDFDVIRTGLSMGGHCLCLTPCRPSTSCPCPSSPITETYAPWYAEKAIDRLRERVVKASRRDAPTVKRQAWMDRVGVGLSESQSIAEAGG